MSREIGLRHSIKKLVDMSIIDYKVYDDDATYYEGHDRISASVAYNIQKSLGKSVKHVYRRRTIAHFGKGVDRAIEILGAMPQEISDLYKYDIGDKELARKKYPTYFL